MEINVSKFIKNTLNLNLSNIIEKIIFIVINIIIANYLSEESFGYYATALSWATFFSVLTNFGQSESLIKMMCLNRGDTEAYLGNAMGIKLLLSIVGFILMFSVVTIAGFNRTIVLLVVILGSVRFMNEFILFLQSFFIGLQKYRIIYFSNTAMGVLFLAGTLISISTQGTVFYIAFARLTAVSVLVALILRGLLKQHSPKLKLSLITPTYIRESLSFGIDRFIRNSNERVSILLISFVCGSLYAGYYQNAYLFISTLLFIPSNIEKTIVPILYNAYREKSFNTFQSIFDIVSKYLNIFAYFLALFLFLFSDDLISVLFSGKYENSVLILKVISFSIPSLFCIASFILTAANMQKLRTRIQSVLFVANIIITVFLSYNYSIIGAALSFVIYALSYAGCTLYMVHSKRVLCIIPVLYNHLQLVIICLGTFVAYHICITGIPDSILIHMCTAGLVFLSGVFLWVIKPSEYLFIKKRFLSRVGT